MCKFIKDILFPLNLLGKKRVCVAYKVTGSMPEDYTLNVVWSGERMEIAYTNRITRTMPGVIRPVSNIHTDGNESEIIVYSRDEGTRFRFTQLIRDTVYFNCTNVTKLIVNGEQLL
jgi:hypothetical protein